MINNILIVLVIATFITSTFVFIRLISLLKSRTEVNRLLLYSFVSLGFVLNYICIRILYYSILGQLIDHVDRYFYSLCFFLLLLNISTTIKMILALSKQSGRENKFEDFMRFLYITAAIIFASVNIFTTYPTSMDIYGHYLYQTNPMISLMVLVAYTPGIILLAYLTIDFLRKIKDKSVIKNFSFVGVAFIVLPTLNFAYFGSYYIVPNYYIFHIIYLIAMLIIMLVSFTFFLKNPDFLEAVTTYFATKSLYIIEEAGQMIYSYNFQDVNKDYFTSKELLLGGFIHAITSGIQSTIGASEKVQAMDLGDTTLVIKHGKYVFGVLFATENFYSLHRKLDAFIERFEEKFSSILEDWSGELTAFSTCEIHAILEDIFKYSK